MKHLALRGKNMAIDEECPLWMICPHGVLECHEEKCKKFYMMY